VNGWKNHQTWNVALWLQNDEPLYRLARIYRGRSYTRLAAHLARNGLTHTPDGVSYTDSRLSRSELTAMLRDL
jgi:hypothetical protein